LSVCGGITDYDFKVLGDGDLGAVDVYVVGAEAREGDSGAGCGGYVVECWNPYFSISNLDPPAKYEEARGTKVGDKLQYDEKSFAL